MTALRAIAPAAPAIAADVLYGLTRRPKALPSRLFYDARGSELFEQITCLPEYYLTRTERDILTDNAGEMAASAGSNFTLIELGAGTAAKTGTIIEAALRRQLRLDYWPIDVSPDALRAAAQRLAAQFERLRVYRVVADYTRELNAISSLPGQKLVLYLGSSIGNFRDTEAIALLRALRAVLNPGDALLLGTDMVKAEEILLPAYDDPQGVTAAFNKNLLVRINRELDGAFNLDRFRHVARCNAARSRMEMYLESIGPQTVEIRALDLHVRFSAGERIHTEDSHKYSLPRVRSILRHGGFALERTWSDRRQWFSVHLARVV